MKDLNSSTETKKNKFFCQEVLILSREGKNQKGKNIFKLTSILHEHNL